MITEKTKLCDLEPGGVTSGFELEKRQYVEAKKATLYTLRHKKCGARLLYFDRADLNKTFAVSFKTLPENDTGFFALHIHEGGDCGGTDFSDTGGHFNPEAQEHPRHAGDLPPLLSVGGHAFLSVETGRFTPCEVSGRTVVIHGSADDFHTQPAGNAGKKIACGVIRRV